MAYLYTPEQIQEALNELRIKPLQGTITSREAARILGWRARQEFGIERNYNEGAVRRHINLGNLKPVQPEDVYINRYKVEDIFDLPLSPRRGYRPTESDEPEATLALARRHAA
jgi:hypothetical protein